MKENSNSRKQIEKNRKKRKLSKLGLFIALMIFAGIIGVLIALIDFFGMNPVRRSVSMSIEFTYDGVAQNQLPNSEAFTIDGILRDDVIESALVELGLKDYYSVDSIRESLMVKGSFPKDVIERLSTYNSVYDYNVYRDVEEDTYYPSVYTITLFDDYSSKTTTLEMTDILETIVKRYKEYFVNTYVYSFDRSTNDTILEIDDVDYRHQINLLDGRIDMLRNYASFLYSKEPNFLYKNMNFKDYTVKCDDLKKNSLQRLEAIIMMKAYSKAPERLRNMYQYRIQLLNNEQNRTRERLTEIEKLIDGYEMDDILYVGMSGDAYVKVDSNSRETYEQLTSKKISVSERITAINEDILKNNEYLTDLVKSVNNTSAESEINAVSEKLNAIEQEFAEMIGAYNEYIISRDNILLGRTYYTSPKLFSGAFIKRAVKVTAPVCMIFLILFCGVMILTEKKKVIA